MPDRYPINELIPVQKLQAVLRDSVCSSLILIDKDLNLVVTTGLPMLCQLVLQGGERCPECPLEGKIAREVCAQEVCSAQVLTTTHRVGVGGYVVAHVAHQQPLPDFYLANRSGIQGLDDEMRSRIEELGSPAQIDRVKVRAEVRRIARSLSQRLSNAWKRRVEDDAVRQICRAANEDELLEGLFRGVADLCGDVAIRLYAQGSDGVIHLVRSRGMEDAQLPSTLSTRSGHVGQVISDRRSLYRPNLEANPDGFVFDSGKCQPRSVFTVPMVWRTGPGALQLLFPRLNALREGERALTERLALIAETASDRLVLKKETQAPASFHTSTSWSTLLVDLALGTSRASHEVLEARRRLYIGLCDEAKRISGAKYISVRLVDSRTGGMRFVACLGDGWDATSKMRFYSAAERSAGMAAIEKGSAIYIDDVTRNKVPYIALHAEVKSLYVIPFVVTGRTRGVLSIDWNQPNGGPAEMRAQLDQLVQEFERVLEILEQREDYLFRQLEEAMTNGAEAQIGKVLVRNLRKMFQAKACSLFVVPPGESNLTLLASTHPKPNEMPSAYPIGYGLTGWVAKERRSLRLVDARDEEELLAISPTLHNARYWSEDIEFPAYVKHGFLAAPMLAGRTASAEKLVGVIRLAIKDEHSGDPEPDFSYEEESILSELAARIGKSIFRVWREQAATERLRAGEAAIDAHRLPDLKSTAQAFADQIARSEEAAGCYLMVKDLHAGLRASGTSGLLKVIQSENGPVHTEGPEKFVTVFAHEDEWADLNQWQKSTWPDNAPIHSAARLSLPFAGESGFKGHIFLVWRHAEYFLEDRQLYLQAMARQVVDSLSPPLVYHRTQAELRKKLEEIQELKDAVLDLAQTNNYSRLMESVLERARKAAHMDQGTIRIWDASSKLWRLEAPIGLPADQVPEFIEDHELFQRSARGSRPHVTADTRSDGIWNAYKDLQDEERRKYLEGIKTSLHIPLRINNQCFGLIMLEGADANPLDESLIDYLAILSHILTMAVWFAQDQKLNRPVAVMGAMLSGFLHVIRNRLNDIFATLSLTIDMAQGDPELSDELLNIRKYLSRLTDVTEAIARASNSESAKLSEMVDLNRLLEGAVNDFSPRMRQDVEIGTRFGAGPVSVSGSSEFLKMAFYLVIQNAFEAMESKGRLQIETESDGHQVRIRFRDNGPGMDENTSKHCFDFFFTTKERFGGTGMGLPVVRGVLIRHGGTAEIEASPDRGCTILLTLPLRSEK